LLGFSRPPPSRLSLFSRIGGRPSERLDYQGLQKALFLLHAPLCRPSAPYVIPFGSPHAKRGLAHAVHARDNVISDHEYGEVYPDGLRRAPPRSAAAPEMIVNRGGVPAQERCCSALVSSSVTVRPSVSTAFRNASTMISTRARLGGQSHDRAAVAILLVVEPAQQDLPTIGTGGETAGSTDPTLCEKP